MKILAILVFILALIIINRLKKKEKISSKIAFFISALFVVLILEFSVFNVKSYRTNFTKQDIVIYQKEDLSDITEEQSNIKKVNIENLNKEVQTVYIELLANNAKNKYIKYQLSYSDETTKMQYLPEKIYNQEVNSSKYTAVYLSGKVKNLQISIQNVDGLEINKIIINKTIPFNFNFIRVIILFLFIILIYSFKHDEIWLKPYDEKDYKQTILQMSLLIPAILIVYFINIYNSEFGLDLYNYNFVNAIENGQVSLLEEPSEKLLNLKNPYDLTERSSIIRNVDYIWDAALYNNHYYVYFGILPALLFLVPFHLIFGEYLNSATIVLIFSILSLFLIFLLIKFIFEKWFEKTNFKMLWISEAIAMFGSFIIWINVAPRFYEMASICGLYFALQGLYLVLKGIYQSKDDISYKKLTLGSLCLALSVACRPTELLISIIILPILLNKLIENIRNKKNILKLLLSTCIPYIIVGILLMAYNYIRFGNILEFGAKYQLTMNDMLHLKNRFAVMPLGFLCNLFNFPIITGKFPFINSNGNMFDLYSYYYIEDMPGGVFFLAPIAFMCFGIFKFYKICKNKDLKNFTFSLIFVGILLNIVTAMQAGSTGRYLLDFSWIFVVAGIIIFMTIYENYKTMEAKKILEKVISFIALYIVIINILSGFSNIGGQSMIDKSPKEYLNIRYNICFWE